MQTSYPYRISRSELNLQDEPINLDALTEYKDTTIFSTDRLNNRPNELFDDFVSSLDFEANLDKIVIERINYTILDAMAAVGGLAKVLNTGLTIFVAILNYNHIETFIASNIYKIRKEVSKGKVDVEANA